MKKNIVRVLAIMMCVVMCLVTNLSASAASIPYKNYKTTGSGNYTFTIDTSSFSGYSDKTIGHFSVETQGYSSSAYITVTIKHGSTTVGSCFAPTNGKTENNGFSSNFYYPPGVYTITVSVINTSSSGWTGVWLYH